MSVTTLTRRLVSIPGVFLLLPFGVLISPLVLPGLAIVDLATAKTKLPSVRLYLFFLVFLAHELRAQPTAFFWWITRQLDYERHRELQAWWTGSLFTWAGRLLGIRIEMPDTADLPDGPLIVLSRHASMVDALIPARVLADVERPVHYILKKELRWIPAIDVFGHRLRNHFVERGGNTEREVADIHALASTAEPGAAMAIFPEGTYSTPTTRARVRESLAKRGNDALVAFADELQRLLPPKPAGALALLDALPNAPVMILGHVGMEGVAEIEGLRRHLPAEHPVGIRWWIHERDTLPPLNEESFTTWLQQQWRVLDQWVDEQLQGR